MNEASSPFLCHVFVCVNDRHGERQSCADGDGALIKARLKEAVTSRGLKLRVRVSQSSCLGLCAKGPNVMIYPQGIYFSAVTPGDTDAIVAKIEALVG